MEMLKKHVIIVLLFLSLLIFGVITLIIFRKCCFSDYCEIPIPSHDKSLVFARLREGKFLYPSEGDEIIVDRGESFILGCPGSKLNVNAEYSSAECLTETNFRILDDNVDITSLFCEDQSQITARYTGKYCEDKGQEIEIGFDFGNFFLRQIRVCFDEKEQNTLYSEHNLTNYIDKHESSGKPYFVQGNFYNLTSTKLDELYSRKIQRATINQQLGIDSNSDKIINGSSFFLSRGHLAPRGDFFYSLQMNASFYYVNSAPQWSIINSLSWNDLEKRIRSFATERKTDLQIFTGTYGKLELLPDKSKQPVQLYLYSQNSTKAIPIPEIFWKVVFDPVAKMGVAFVGTNNPYLEKNKVNFYCKDISEKITWVTLNNKNMTRGFIYGCDVDNLRSKIPFIPHLDITSVLTK